MFNWGHVDPTRSMFKEIFWKSAGATLLSVSPPVPPGCIHTIRSRDFYPGGITSLFRGAPAILCCVFKGLEESCGLLQAGTLLAEQTGQELPQITHIYPWTEAVSNIPWKDKLRKKNIVKPCLGSQTLFSPQNYVLFAIITMSTFCHLGLCWSHSLWQKHWGLPAVQQHQNPQTFPLLIL